MNPAILLFLVLISIFLFTITSFIRKNQRLRQSQITREQTFLSLITRNNKDSPP